MVRNSVPSVGSTLKKMREVNDADGDGVVVVVVGAAGDAPQPADVDTATISSNREKRTMNGTRTIP